MADQTSSGEARAAAFSATADFFRSRWHRVVPLWRLFWVDMILVGSLVNVATTLGSLMALGFKAELWVAMAIFFAPLPYNVFLAAAVWRTAELAPSGTASVIRLASITWLLAATVI